MLMHLCANLLDGGNCDFLSRYSEKRQKRIALGWHCLFAGGGKFTDLCTREGGHGRICYFQFENRRPHHRKPRSTNGGSPRLIRMVRGTAMELAPGRASGTT